MGFNPDTVTKAAHLEQFKREILKHPDIPILVFGYFGLCHSSEEINLVWQKLLKEKLVKPAEIESIVNISNICGMSLKAPIVIKLVDRIKEYIQK